jgi:hypothetical protein
MKFEIVKLNQFNGNKCGVYSIFIDDEQDTLFDRFLYENVISFKDEITSILQRLNTINKKTGASEHFFKLEEGNPGDGVCALFDVPDSNLRLYCIRYGNSIIILGGGGEKPKNIRAFQKNDKLKEENYLLRAISKKIAELIREKEILFSDDETEIIGNLIIEEDE